MLTVGHEEAAMIDRNVMEFVSERDMDLLCDVYRRT
jgi:hypothetical protein